MKSILTLSLLVILVLPLHAAHAEGGCPPGMLPAQGTDINSCAPIPQGYYGDQKQSAQSLPPQPRWSSRWGAIATDSIKGVIGAATESPNKSQAQQAALTECQAKGGSSCKLEIAYDNECAALVAGDNGYNVGTDITLEKVVALGMKICTDAKNSNCRVYYSACSLPAQIQ